MKVLVCGSRHATNPEHVFRALESLDPRPELVIAGCARGVDMHARAWALSKGVPVAMYQAAWEVLGPAAGPRRNAAMIQYGKPDLVVAFPGGTGTADTVRRATEVGIEVRRIEW